MILNLYVFIIEVNEVWDKYKWCQMLLLKAFKNEGKVNWETQ